jgi:hypothetical protein
MKFLTSIIFAWGLSMLAPQPVQAHASMGVIAATPEAAGIYASVFPSAELSIDGWATLSTVDFGVSTYVPLSLTSTSRHSFVLTGMGGYVHNLVENHDHYGTSKYHALLAAGYGYRNISGWDFRAQIGPEFYSSNPIQDAFHGHVMIGHMF